MSCPTQIIFSKTIIPTPPLYASGSKEKTVQSTWFFVWLLRAATRATKTPSSLQSKKTTVALSSDFETTNHFTKENSCCIIYIE